MKRDSPSDIGIDCGQLKFGGQTENGLGNDVGQQNDEVCCSPVVFNFSIILFRGSAGEVFTSDSVDES